MLQEMIKSVNSPLRHGRKRATFSSDRWRLGSWAVRQCHKPCSGLQDNYLIQLDIRTLLLLDWGMLD